MPQGYLRSLHSIGGGTVFTAGTIKITRTSKNKLTVDIMDANGKVVYALPEMEVLPGDSLTLRMPTDSGSEV